MATLYVADQLSHPPQPNPPMGYGKIHRVTSAPASDLGSDGDAAINTTTGDFYEKFNGAWTLSMTGGVGGGGALACDGAPTVTYPAGPPSGTEGTPYVNRLTGQIFWWYSSQWN